MAIKDGNIRGWGSDGIKSDLSGTDHFSSLYITQITGNGILVNSGTVMNAM